MSFARVISAASACVVLGAAVAACSGSFGSGTSMPQALASLGPNANATATPTPTSSTTILTYGESDAFQALPEVGGYAGAIALPKPTATVATASAAKGDAKAKASPAAAPTPISIAIGATLSVVKPDDGPDLNFVSGKGKHKRTRELPARALAYIKLLPTHDITLESYPRIMLDVPRELAAQYRDGEFGLALWNAGEKEQRYRLSVAERDLATPAPNERPSAKPSVRPSATPVPSPAASGARGTSAVTPAPTTEPQLPPQRVAFLGTAAPLKLVANRPLIFALYALPHPSSTPAPSAAPSATPAAKATP